MSAEARLDVVIVAYGSPDLLDTCLGQLAGELPVLVVDNGSDRETRSIAQRWGARYIDAGRNLGFGAAVNLALRDLGSAHGDVLLLNPDARVDAGTVRALQRHLHAPWRDRVACAAPRLVNDQGHAERVHWPFPSPGRAWLDTFGVGSRWSRPHDRDGFLIGAVLMLRAEAITEIGLFDERFFLYAEETDWQHRATLAGWSVLSCDSLMAAHVGAGTSTDGARREALFHAAAERYIRKWYGSWGWRAWRAGVVLGAGVRSVTGPRRALQQQRLRAYLRGPVRLEAIVGRPS